jgi:hypothetical protein
VLLADRGIEPGFVVSTFFDSLEAVKDIAGPDYATRLRAGSEEAPQPVENSAADYEVRVSNR